MDARPDRPILSKGTRVVRQVEDGKARWIVRAGASGKYLRIGEAEATLLELLDGKRTLEEVRRAYAARRKEVIDLAEVRTFLADMRKREVVDPTDAARNLLVLEKARQKRKERHLMGGVGSLLFFRFKLLDPDRFLTAIEPWTRWIFTRGFVLGGVALALVATGILVARWSEVAVHLKGFPFLSGGGGLLALWITALCIVAVHETAHGVACKHWGGEVRDVGFLLLFFQPCFYCNVNDAWTFESRAARLWVTAAGGVAEIVLGSFCVLLWAASEPGSALNENARRIFMISLSMTLILNMNPLIKLDGYYLLADFLRVENLRDRSYAHLGFLAKRALGRPTAPVATDRREAWILAAYGVSSSIYMALLIVTLLTVLAGVVLGGASPGAFQVAVIATIAWLMVKRPLVAAGGAVKGFVGTQAGKHGARRVAAGIGGVAAALAMVACLVPWTRVAGGEGTAEPVRVADLRAPLDGVVAEVLAGEGARVASGDPVFRVDSAVEEAAARAERQSAGRLAREALRRRAAGDASGAASATAEAKAAELRAGESEKRIAERTVRSPFEGVVLTRAAAEARGLPVQREQPVVRVGDLSRVRFRTSLDARGVARVRQGMDAVVRLKAFPGEEIEAKVVAVGRSPVETEAAAAAPVAAEPLWSVVVEAPNAEGRVRPGMTGQVQVLYDRTTIAGAVLKGIADTFRRDLLR